MLYGGLNGQHAATFLERADVLGAEPTAPLQHGFTHEADFRLEVGAARGDSLNHEILFVNDDSLAKPGLAFPIQNTLGLRPVLVIKEGAYFSHGQILAGAS